MKKTYFAFGISLLLCLSISLQAQDIPSVGMTFTVDNGQGRTANLVLGAKQGATTGLDPGLSESELPPVPPNEIFDARVSSTPGKSQLGEGSLNDFRPISSTTAPFTETYTISFQGGISATSVKLTWDQPYPGRITKATVDGQDIAAKTEVVSSLTQGTFTIVLTIDFQPLAFTANPASLSITAGDRDSVFVSKNIDIIPVGDAQAAWLLVPGESWLSASPSSGYGRQTVEVSINTNQIANGTHNTTLLVRSPIEPARLDIPIILNFTVGIEDMSAPNGMRLQQNYPNPFTPSTAFDVDLGIRSSSIAPILKVYNSSGKEVADLSSKLQRVSGFQTVVFDAGDIPAGMYSYTLSYDGHELTRTMVLVK